MNESSLSAFREPDNHLTKLFLFFHFPFQRDRFSYIIDGLKYTDNDSLRVSCMQLINALIAHADELDYRIHLRNEIMRSGFSDIQSLLPIPTHDDEDMDQEKDKDVSNKTPTELLGLQVEVFNIVQQEDYFELETRFRETITFDFDNPYVCFELISQSVKNTHAEHSFRSILQHLLLIRDDVNVKSAYFQLADDAVSQIVMYKKSTFDPDFRYKSRVELDLHDITIKIAKYLEEAEKVSASTAQRLQEALTEKEEAQAKCEKLQKQLEEALKAASGELPAEKRGITRFFYHYNYLIIRSFHFVCSQSCAERTGKCIIIHTILVSASTPTPTSARIGGTGSAATSSPTTDARVNGPSAATSSATTSGRIPGCASSSPTARNAGPTGCTCHSLVSPAHLRVQTGDTAQKSQLEEDHAHQNP